MNKIDFEKLPRKATEVYVKDFVVKYLNHDYELELFTNAFVNRENGYLGIGELSSPENIFKFRWDEKDSEPKIDVDLKKVGENEIFKDFKGHHTKLISDLPNRKYSFDIFYPEGKKIFKAIIEMSVKTENRIEKSLQYCIKSETESKNL